MLVFKRSSSKFRREFTAKFRLRFLYSATPSTTRQQEQIPDGVISHDSNSSWPKSFTGQRPQENARTACTFGIGRTPCDESSLRSEWRHLPCRSDSPLSGQPSSKVLYRLRAGEQTGLERFKPFPGCFDAVSLCLLLRIRHVWSERVLPLLGGRCRQKRAKEWGHKHSMRIAPESP
jgi:hypothetical protein